MNITVNSEYQKLVPPLHSEELKALAEDIGKNGLIYPLIVNDKGIVLDGHHRLQICTSLAKNLEYKVRSFKDELDEREFVINVNLKRRHLNDFQKAELGFQLEKIESERSKQRMLSGKTVAPNDARGKTSEIISKKVGITTRTYERSKKIIQKGSEELKKNVRSGKTSISYGHKTIKRSEDHQEENIPEIPKGIFDIILADPPWSYDINTRGSPDDHYAVMTDKQIQNLNIPSADNAILFLWATSPKLREALKVIKEWGFEYKTSAVWIKDKIGTGYYFRGQHEFLLVAEKGDMPTPQEKDRRSSVIESPRLNHSQKPEIVYKIIESMYPNRSYLELFARKQRQGWTSWGSELQK